MKLLEVSLKEHVFFCIPESMILACFDAKSASSFVSDNDLLESIICAAVSRGTAHQLTNHGRARRRQILKNQSQPGTQTALLIGSSQEHAEEAFY